MKNIILSAALVISSVSHGEPLPMLLEAEVKLLASSLTDGYAQFYPEYSQYTEYTVSESVGYEKGIAVLVSMGGWAGGNTNNQYIAAYAVNRPLFASEKNKKYRLVSFALVGGKGDRFFTDLKSAPQGVILTGLEYGENDPSCCPSQAVEVRYFVGRRGDLQEAASR